MVLHLILFNFFEKIINKIRLLCLTFFNFASTKVFEHPNHYSDDSLRV